MPSSMEAASTIFSTVASPEFEHSYSESFGNADLTKLVGTGQTLYFSDSLPYSENPLAETYAYSYDQVSKETFEKLLEDAYNDMRIPNGDRIPLASGDCVFWFGSECPSESAFQFPVPCSSLIVLRVPMVPTR